MTKKRLMSFGLALAAVSFGLFPAGANAIAAAAQVLHTSPQSDPIQAEVRPAVPVQPVSDAATLAGVSSISIGASTLALMTDGTVRVWGNNAYQQISSPASSRGVATPTTVSGISTATAISGSAIDHYCLLLTSSVRCAGGNVFGELGDGTTSNSTTPVTPTGLGTVSAIAVGTSSSCALVSGTPYCWGIGSAYASSVHPTASAISGISTATAIAAGGESNFCARLSDSTVRCWGANRFGLWGDGAADGMLSLTPVQVTGITTATAISVGPASACALLSGGSVKCWGLGSEGALGNSGTASSSTPVSVTGISTASAVSVGEDFACALLSTGSISCWGANTYGQLGDGSTSNRTAPVAVSGITTATAIAAGNGAACAVLADQSARCWGSNAFGQLGDGTFSNSSTPVTVSGS